MKDGEGAVEDAAHRGIGHEGIQELPERQVPHGQSHVELVVHGVSRRQGDRPLPLERPLAERRREAVDANFPRRSPQVELQPVQGDAAGPDARPSKRYYFTFGVYYHYPMSK